MTKALIGVLSLALVGVGGLVAAVDGFGDDRPIRSVSIPAGTTTGAADVSGPCDEPEHPNDARCTGAGTATAADDEHSGSDNGHDNSGPGGSDDDNSGSGSDDD